MPGGSEDPCTRWRTIWFGIPSDVPSPARALLIQVNGSYNDGGTTLTNLILIRYGVMVTQLTLTQSF